MHLVKSRSSFKASRKEVSRETNFGGLKNSRSGGSQRIEAHEFLLGCIKWDFVTAASNVLRLCLMSVPRKILRKVSCDEGWSTLFECRLLANAREWIVMIKSMIRWYHKMASCKNLRQVT